MSRSGPDILGLDRRHVWHPFTQHATEASPVPIAAAKGASLFDAEGREILDLISSWWTCTHGHGHPALVAALAEQARTLDHVMFAGFTHEPAARLAAALTARLPEGLSRVFFSDDGSTAVEVALKLAYQYWRNRGETGRSRFLAFEGGYHGDTLGAMALGSGSGFFTLFRDLMCEVVTVPFASTFADDPDVAAREAEALGALDGVLDVSGGTIAALVMEPLMQGAGGMRFCRPEFVRAVVERARAHGILVVFDEVATGFGRTGTLFACEQTSVAPDIVCLSKGLTAGMLPLSVTVAREELYQAFLGPAFDKALAHGHSFTANPLACAVALRSLDLFEEEGTMARIARIETAHRSWLEALSSRPDVARARILGTILAFDLAGAEGYKSERSQWLRDWCLARGLNVRPLGPTVYLRPPYCITDDELGRAHAGLGEALDALG